MKMVVISADEYEKLKNEKKESETKIEAYKQCIAGYESRIKELTEEHDNLKDASFDMYKKLTADNKRLAKTVLNSAYGVEQDICCRISKNLNASMFDKISQLSDENEKLKKESAEKSEWLKAKNEALDNLIIAYNKLEKEHKELKASAVSFDCHNGLIEDNEKLAIENHKLKDQVQSLKCDIGLFDTELQNKIAEIEKLKIKVSSLETQLKDCKYMYENKLKNTEATLKAVVIDNNVNNSFIKTLRSQAEEDAYKTKELRQKYEAVLKTNEKLAAENSRLANDPEIIRLNNELKILKKQYKDLNNAYKSQKNELLKLKNKPDDKYDILREQYNCLYIDYERVKLIRKEYEDRLNKIESLANV